MNIFSLLLGFILLAGTAAGVICAIVCAIKRNWKGVAWCSGITGAIWAGCFGLLYLFHIAADNTLRRPVTEAEIIGTWHLSQLSMEAALRDVPSAKKDAYLIDLRKDGTCRYFSFEQFPERVADAEGQWKIQQRYETKDTWELRIDLAKKTFTINFGENAGQLYLWEYWLDPDSADVLRYEKRPKT